MFERDIARELAEHAGYHAIQKIPGVGQTFAAIFAAEIGDVTRFTSPQHLCSWAGLTPRHRESDTTLHRVPEAGRSTLTWDQGREMALWSEIERRLGTPVFFADPHAPWQRPLNENFIGLIRRWLPKSTDLSAYCQDDLDTIARRINHMPRGSFDWAHAHRRYDDALVAMTA
ncbi:MAG: IS30 family transposase [Acidimicrobiales bacterium]